MAYLTLFFLSKMSNWGHANPDIARNLRTFPPLPLPNSSINGIAFWRPVGERKFLTYLHLVSNAGFDCESESGGNASHLTHPVLTRLRGAKADPKTANNADHIILSKCTQVLKTHIGRLHIYELCKNEAVLVAL